MNRRNFLSLALIPILPAPVKAAPKLVIAPSIFFSGGGIGGGGSIPWAHGAVVGEQSTEPCRYKLTESSCTGIGSLHGGAIDWTGSKARAIEDCIAKFSCAFCADFGHGKGGG